MAPSLLSVATGALLLAATASAHFTVSNPAVMQPFNEDSEDQAPCGGYTPDLSAATTVTDFHVGGDSVGTKSSHPQTNWLYRVTTDNAGAGNWTQIGQIVTQSGSGALCQSKITAPEAWVGKKAILSIVGNGPDGMLYQCAAVNFVAGTASSVPSTCTTGSSVQSFGATDSALSALVSSSGSGSGSSSQSPSGTQSSTTTSPTASATPKNAASVSAVSSFGALAAAVVGLAAMVV